MSEDATNSSKMTMDCARVARQDVVEGYVLGTLNEDDRTAFESHYFACARCFRDLQLLQAIRREVPLADAPPESKTLHPAWRWAPAAGLAAAILLGVTTGVVIRRQGSSGVRQSATSQPPSAAQSVESARPQTPAPLAAAPPSLEQLARVDPPEYAPATLRGPEDDSARLFEQGMERYARRDYQRAVASLTAAAAANPAAAHIQFFLGISYLMTAKDDDATRHLRETIALGDSPFLEAAHFYLAKALLRRANLDAAEIELKKVVDLRGSRAPEATQLLKELARVRGSRE
jgi:tetratricopeptide (TPR) repeat protein